MRYRSKGQLTNLQTIYTNLNSLGCTAPSVTANVGGKVGEKIETWDVVTPRYFSRRREGEIIVNPYTNIKQTWFNSINGVHSKANEPWSGTTCYQEAIRDGPQLSFMLEQIGKGLSPKTLIPQTEIDRITQLAATKARNEVLNGEAELLVFLAELHKTFRLLLNPTRELASLFQKIRQHWLADKGSNALSLVEYISKEWLKYRYGIMPLMYDIQGIIKALSKDKKGDFHTARGSETLEYVEDLPLVHMHGDVDTSYNWVTTDKVVVKCGLIYSAKMLTSDYLGFNLRSFPSAVWELIPFSFVIDWFVNVQAFVGAFGANGAVPVQGQYTVTTRTIMSSYVVQGSVIARNPGSSTLIRPMSGTETVVWRAKARTDIVPAPSLTRKINLSAWNPDRRVFDSFALVLQQLARGR